MITLNFKVGDTIRLKKDPNKKDNKRRTKAKITAIDNTCYKIEVLDGINRGCNLNVWHQSQDEFEIV